MESIGEIIKSKKKARDFRNTHEYQAYGNRLAEEFDDVAHRSLYIKFAKTKARKLLEQARDFVMSQEHIYKKGPLFMWKLKELEDKAREKTPNNLKTS
jgi:hypothetical protein